MTTRMVASVGKFFGHRFPERQLYHRSRGTVQFVTLTARAQIGLLIVTLGFLGWVAYASVNVVFKDQIIAAKEQHFATLQAAYEGRLADMQAAYDELNSALVLTQDRFAKATTELEEKHRQIAEIFARQQAALGSLGTWREQVATAYKAQNRTADGNQIVMSPADGPIALAGRESENYMGGALGDGELDTDQLGGIFGINITQGLPAPHARVSHRLEQRMTTLDAAQRDMVSELEVASADSIKKLERIVGVTGLNVDRVLDQVAADNQASSKDGQGGPYFPIGSKGVRVDAEFTRNMDALHATVYRLASLQSALASIPLVSPIQGDRRFASRFGKRTDPFTGRPAFHYGLDIVAPFKTPVLAPTPGVIVFAGRHGPYGNLVEIDHGNGMRTRFGHLYAVSVKVGDKVGFQQQVGLLGSTGRSTGPHLHYEVRFNGTLRDPALFLEAGRYVFQG